MKKSIQIAAVLGLAFVMLSATPVLAEGDVAAVVNGSKIFKEDVKQALDALQVKSEEKDKMYPLALDQVINEKLLDEETAKANLDQTDDFKNRMTLARGQILKQIYLEKFLKDKISESKIKSEYDKFKSENKGKQEIRARHILLASEEEAKKVIEDLNKGAKFEDLAKKRSSGPTAQNGGDLGYFTKEDVVPEFSDAAFKLKVGTYTKAPVKTQFGYHVILVEDKRARKIPELKEVELAIRNKLGQDALQKLVLDLRAKSDIKRFGADGKPLPEQGQN